MEFNTLYIDRSDAIISGIPKRLNFRSVANSFSDVISVLWDTIPVFGRADVLRLYDHTAPRVLTIPLQFYASADFGEVTSSGALKSSDGTQAVRIENVNEAEAFNQVVERVRWCQSLAYPAIKEAKDRGRPPIVTLILGGSGKDSGGNRGFVSTAPVSIKGVVTAVSTEWKTPWAGANLSELRYPQFADVTLTIETFRAILGPREKSISAAKAESFGKRTENISASDVYLGKAWQIGEESKENG